MFKSNRRAINLSVICFERQTIIHYSHSCNTAVSPATFGNPDEQCLYFTYYELYIGVKCELYVLDASLFISALISNF